MHEKKHNRKYIRAFYNFSNHNFNAACYKNVCKTVCIGMYTQMHKYMHVSVHRLCVEGRILMNKQSKFYGLIVLGCIAKCGKDP